MAAMANNNPQSQAPNADLFDAYFRRADLDRDGRISGAEAVAFFQGSGLPKPVLAKIWSFADKSKSGYLGRNEFFNALKLVTVAQIGRELTPQIVEVALYSPAGAKIPAPRINFVTPQSNFGAPTSTTPTGSFAPTATANPGPRGTTPSPPSSNVNQQHFASQGSHVMRPPLAVSGTASRPLQGVSSQGLPSGSSVAGMQPSNANTLSSWSGGKTSGSPLGAVSQVPTQPGAGPAASGATASLPPRPPTAPKMMTTSLQGKDATAFGFGVSGNGLSSSSAHGGDAFSGIASRSMHNSPTINVPVSAGAQPLQNSSATQPVGSQPRNHSFAKHNMPASSYASPVAVSSASGQSQQLWPKLTQTAVEKYTKVFVAVDTDKDGKITGEQARNLFLSWRLPREVLKQVWDLSDQDNDSMLSLKEFCIALYLMERYREGRPLPALLPKSIMIDLSSIGPPMTGHNTTSWGPKSDWQQQQTAPTASSGQRMPVAAGLPMPSPAAATLTEEGPPANEQKSKVPVLEKHLLDQLSQEEQDSLNSKFKEATDSEKKVAELEKEILESRQKIEFYRGKMQEIVLYKSRCDNRLNEITERTYADKREVELLAKKYEEKYKQVGDVASRLTIEESTFRDIQEKKMELYQAIVRLEQGSDADGNLQASVEKIQAELDELVKTLNERCKQYGLRGRPTTLLELPFGWQPGIQEGAADWDKDWDKFEDEGFTFVKEFTLDVQNVVAPPKPKSVPSQKSASSGGDSETAGTTADAAQNVTEATSPKAENNVKSEKPADVTEKVAENGSAYGRSENESATSITGNPVDKSDQENPSKDVEESDIGKFANAETSPREKETESDHEGSASVFDKGFDEPSWGAFDNNDDIDSVWGFNATSATKDNDFGENDFFGSGLNPIRTQTPETGSLFQKKSTFSFDESVPSTPLYSSTNSPQKASFDNYSRYDSFNMHDSGLFPPQETLSRFDSFRSNKDSDYGHGFPSFDDSDPFGTGPFRTSLDSQTPRRYSDSDPFGSGLFKTPLESQTPRGVSDSDFFGAGTSRTSLENRTSRSSFDSDPFGTEPFRTSRDNETPRSSNSWSAF